MHIFDRFGRCLLSNENINDIKQKTYSAQDFTRIQNYISNANQVDVSKYIKSLEEDAKLADKSSNTVNDYYMANMAQLEIKYLTEIRDTIPKMENMGYLTDYIEKIIEAMQNLLGIKTT